jgi:hypothetical protein
MTCVRSAHTFILIHNSYARMIETGSKGLESLQSQPARTPLCDYILVFLFSLPNKDYFFVSNKGLTGLFSWIRLIASPIKPPTLTSSILSILRSSGK